MVKSRILLGPRCPNASLTLTNTSTNASQMTTTNGHGTYRFAFLPSRTYKVIVSANGFQTQDHPGVVVTAGQPTSVNAQLAVAGASTEVNVVEATSSPQ